MGHSSKYRIKQKRALQSELYVEPMDEPEETKKSDAWRRIEEYQMLQQIRHDLEFYDDHQEGDWDDYLQ